MADPEDRENVPSREEQAQPTKGLTGKSIPWLITGLAIVVCAGTGFVIGRVFGMRGQTQTVSAAEQPGAAGIVGGHGRVDEADTEPGWYYDLDAVVANLNEPGVTRYARVGLTLEIDNDMSQSDGTAFLDRKKPLLKHWLNLYLSNQTMEDIRGERHLRRMQAQISETFNRGLFPNQKPRIKRVLFKELSIQ